MNVHPAPRGQVARTSRNCTEPQARNYDTHKAQAYGYPRYTTTGLACHSHAYSLPRPRVQPWSTGCLATLARRTSRLSWTHVQQLQTGCPRVLCMPLFDGGGSAGSHNITDHCVYWSRRPTRCTTCPGGVRSAKRALGSLATHTRSPPVLGMFKLTAHPQWCPAQCAGSRGRWHPHHLNPSRRC